MTDGWQVDPRPVPPELTEGYEAPPFDPTLPYEHAHIRDWASFGELAGEEGMKRLMKAVR